MRKRWVRNKIKGDQTAKQKIHLKTSTKITTILRFLERERAGREKRGKQQIKTTKKGRGEGRKIEEKRRERMGDKCENDTERNHLCKNICTKARII